MKRKFPNKNFNLRNSISFCFSFFKKTALFVLLIFLSESVLATTYSVTTNADSGAGSFRDALVQANASAGNTINMSAINGQTISLASHLPAIVQSMTITGSSVTINGNNLYSAPIVYAGPLTISNVTFSNTLARGGDGASGGGGGMGAGFLITPSPYSSSASVNATDVHFVNNRAQGGNGSASPFGNNGGGGGGLLGGNGGTSPTEGDNYDAGGGGGGIAAGGGNGGTGGFTGNAGVGGTGGNSAVFSSGPGAGVGGFGYDFPNNGKFAGGGGIFGGGGGGGASETGNGGSGGGGGPGGTNGAFGQPSSTGNAGGGAGGFGGGGGGGAFISPGGNGGFGGGGGGGGESANGGGSVFGGGNGATGNGSTGGGGSAFGGACFVGGPLTLNYTNNTTAFSGNSVVAGSGGSNGQALGADLYLYNNAALTVNISNGVTQTFSTEIPGNGNITTTGSGTLALTGVNTFQGTVTIGGGGVLSINADSGLGNTGNAISFQNASILRLANSINININRILTLNTGGGVIDTNGANSTISGQITGAGSFTKQNTGTLSLTNANNNYVGGTNIIGGKLLIGADGALGSTSGGGGGISFQNGGILQISTSFNLNASRTITLNSGGGVIDTNGSNMTIPGSITGVGSLTKQGAGTQTLTGTSNNYSGTTIITAGTLALGAANVLPNGNNLMVTAGTLSMSGNNQTVGDLLTGTGTIALGAGTLTFGTTNTTASFAGVISGVGGSITKQGTGTQTLTGTSNTYSGTTTITAGTLALGAANVLPSSSNLMVTAGTLSMSGNNQTVGDLLTGTGTIALGAGTLTFGTTNTTASFAGVISGVGGSITKQGTGTQTLTGTSNTYSGTTTITAGTLALGAANVLPSSSNLMVTAGTLSMSGNNQTVGDLLTGTGTIALGAGTLTFGTTNTTASFAGVISGVGGSITKQGTGTQTLTGTSNTYSGTTTITAGTLALGAANVLPSSSNLMVTAGTLSMSGNNQTVGDLLTGTGTIALGAGTLTFGTTNTTASFAGVISGVGGSITKQGTGTQTLTGTSNTYSGTTTITAGTLALGAANVLPSSSNLMVTAGTLSMSGNNQTVGDLLTGTGTIALGAGTLTFGTTNTTASFAGVISGVGGSITKQGTGTQTLTGTSNTYSGTTTIIAGTLALGAANVLPNGNNLMVTAGTLSMSGNNQTVGDLLTGTGTIALGAGTLTFGTTNTTASFAGVISDGGLGGKIIKQNTGTQTLTGANTFTGGATISNGILMIGNAAALGTGTLKLNGGTLQPSIDLSGVNTVTNSFTLMANSFIGGVNNLTLSGTGTLNAQLTISNIGTTTLSNVVDGSSGILKQGTGTLILSALNTYTGDTALAGGRIKILAGGRIAGNVSTISNTGILEMNGGSVSGSITGDGSATSTLLVTNNFTTAGPITNVGTITVQNGTLVANNSITGFNVGGFQLTGNNTALTIGSNGVTIGGGIASSNPANTTTFNVNPGNGNFFTSSGSISNITNINVLSGTFNINNGMAGYSSFVISPGAFVNLGAGFIIPDHVTLNIGGSLNMNGQTMTGFGAGITGSTLNIGGNFIASGPITGVQNINILSGVTTVTNSISNYSSFVLSGTAQLTMGSNAAIINGDVSGGPNTAFNVNVGAGNNYALSGNLINIPTVDVQSGTLLLTAAQSITGLNNLFLSGNGSAVTVNAGTSIAGNVIGTGINTAFNIDVGTGNDYTTQGSITNVTDINILSGNLIVNNPISYNNLILTSNDTIVTFNSNNMPYSGNITSTAPNPNNTTLNIFENIATGGVISNIANINVGNNSTFTVNNAITGYTAFSVGTNLVAGALVLGADLAIPANASLSIAQLGTLNMNSRHITGGINSILALNNNLTTSGNIINVPNISVGNNSTLAISGGSNVSGVSNLTIGGGSTVVVNSGGNLVSTGVATITNNGTLTIDGSASLFGTINGGANSTLNVNNTFFTNGPISNVNTIAVNSAGAPFTINNPVSGFNTFNIAANSLVNLNAGSSLVGTTLTNNGILALNGGTITSSILGGPNAAFNINSNYTTNGPILPTGVNTSAGTITVASPATFTVDHVIANSVNILSNATMILNTDLTIPPNGSLIDSGTLNMNGSNILGSANSSLVLNNSLIVNGAINNVTNIAVNAGTLQLNNQVTGFTNLSIGTQGSVILGADLTIPNGGSIIDSGILNMNGHNIFGTIGGTINLTINSPLSTSGIIGTALAPITNLTVGSGGLFTVNNNVTAENLVLAGNSTLILNTNLNIPNNGVIVNAGNFTMNSNSIIADPNSNTTLNINSTFNSSGAINNISNINVNGIYNINTAPRGFNTFTVASGGIVTLNTNLSIPNNALLNTSGMFNMNGNSLLMGTGSAIAINGTFSVNGLITSSVGASGYTLSVNSGGALLVNNTVSQYTNLSVATGGSVNLNSGGNLLNSIALPGGILNLNGGNLSGNITGNGIVNVNSSFVPSGTISANTLNVNSGSTLTMNNPISVSNQLLVSPNAILLLNNNLNGSLINSGVITHNANAVRTINGNYVHNGTLQVFLNNSSEFSQLQVNGNTALNGGIIQISLPTQNSEIHDQDTFDVIHTGGALTVTALPAIAFPNSAILSFTPSIVGNDLVITANRLNFARVNQVVALEGISSKLDAINSSDLSNDFNEIISLLSVQSSSKDVQNILSQFVPDEINGGLFESSMNLIHLPMEQIIRRSAEMRTGMDRFTSGYAAGDMSDGYSSYGPMVFGNSAKQQPRNGVSGYASNTAGFGFLSDTPLNEQIRIGGAISVGGTTVKKGDSTGSLTTIASVQGTFYSSANYGPLFVDGLLSYGHNHYRGRRHIPALALTATSNYRAGQYSGHIRGGFSMPFYTVEVAPLGYVDYTRLNRERYTEKDAFSANLTVDMRQVVSLQVGMGVKITEVSQAEEFIPEIHALFINDVKSPSLTVTSQFVAGGGAFISEGPLPPKNGINIGGSVTALVSENFLLIGGYDLEAKKTFISHSASLKFKWLF